MTRNSRGVVVGYDGSVTSGTALDWAAAEAELRRLPLTVLLAVEDSLSPSADRIARSGLGEEAAHRYAAESLRRARRSAASVEIVVETHFGAPSHALIQKSGQAALVVLGVHGRNGSTQDAPGPVTLDVTARAHCPVVVIGSSNAPLHAAQTA